MAGFKIADAYVDVTAKADGVPGQVQSAVGKKKSVFSSIGGAVGVGIIGGIAAANIGGAIISFISDGVSYASDLAESVSKTDVVFGKSSQVIHDWAKTTAANIGLPEGAAEDAAGSFGNIFTQMGFTQDAAATMSTSWIQMAADIGSFNNLGTDEVIDMQSAALRGEYDSLQRVFPAINAARVQQEALNETGKTNVDQLTEQEKAQALQNLMLEDGKNATGDFARTSDGFANQQKIVAARTAELAGKFGQLLLPALKLFQDIMLNYIIPAVSGLVDFFVKWAPQIGIFAAAFTVYAIASNAAAIASAALRAVTLVATAAQWAYNAALAANPIGLVVLAIAALVAGLVWFFTKTELGQKLWQGFMDALVAGWNWLWEGVLKPGLNALAEAWSILWGFIKPIIQLIVIYVKIWAEIFTWLYNTILKPIFKLIGAALKLLWDNVLWPVIKAIGSAVKWLADQWSDKFDAIKKVVSTVVGFIKGYLDDAQKRFQKLVDFFSDAPAKIRTALSGVGDAIKNTFKSAFNAVAGFWNRSVGKLDFTIPGWVPGVGGKSFSLPKIPLLAKGGHITGSGAVIVGENGPELLNLQKGASVTPLRRQDGGRGVGGGQSIVIQNMTIDASSVDEIQKVINVFKNLGQVSRVGMAY